MWQCPFVEDFLDGNTCYDEDIEQDPSFYRTFDNREEFSAFENQTKDPVESSKRSEKNYYGEDDLSELFAPENRKKVNLHSFSNDKEKAINFKKILQCFIPEQENQLSKKSNSYFKIFYRRCWKNTRKKALFWVTDN